MSDYKVGDRILLKQKKDTQTPTWSLPACVEAAFGARRVLEITHCFPAEKEYNCTGWSDGIDHAVREDWIARKVFQPVIGKTYYLKDCKLNAKVLGVGHKRDPKNDYLYHVELLNAPPGTNKHRLVDAGTFQELEDVMSVEDLKSGDYVLLKNWNDLTRDRKVPYGSHPTCSTDHNLKQYYGTVALKIERVTHGGHVLLIEFPSDRFSQPVLKSDIARKVADGEVIPPVVEDTNSFRRRIRGVLTPKNSNPIEETEQEQTPLKEIHLNSGETYLLYLNNSEQPLEVNIFSIATFQNNDPKGPKDALTISGVVVPKVITPVRRLRK